MLERGIFWGTAVEAAIRGGKEAKLWLVVEFVRSVRLFAVGGAEGETDPMFVATGLLRAASLFLKRALVAETIGL